MNDPIVNQFSAIRKKMEKMAKLRSINNYAYWCICCERGWQEEEVSKNNGRFRCYDCGNRLRTPVEYEELIVNSDDDEVEL
jgi:transcription initiation factor IIE alpha subunit